MKNDLIKHYHNLLFKNNKVIEYLNNKGITNRQLYERFKIGYSDGNIQKLLSKKQIKELEMVNIINDKGEESLLNNIIIPVFDLKATIVDIYGINIDDDSTKCILNNNSIFNIKAIKVFDEIILTNSIIDCLCLINIGFENTICLKDLININEHIKIFKDNRVKTIIVTDDCDNSIIDILTNEDFIIKIIKKIETFDKKEIQSQIDNAEIIEITKNKKDSFSVIKDDYKYIFNIRDIVYVVTGVKEVFVSNLRVSIRAEFEGEWFPDNIDLYSARSRTSFSLSISKKFNIEEKRIENDLLRILDYFEIERDRILKSNNEEDQEEILTDDERKIGLEFLKSKNIFKQIIDDMSTLGYVGEDLNKQLLYLCASSRKLVSVK